jgi:hypothetical protein
MLLIHASFTVAIYQGFVHPDHLQALSEQDSNLHRDFETDPISNFIVIWIRNHQLQCRSGSATLML